MYYTHFLSKDQAKKTKYKQYNNLLTKLENIAKQDYYIKYFQNCQYNMKTTWRLIVTLSKRKTKALLSPAKLIINDIVYTSKQDMANQFNNYFVNIGPDLAGSMILQSISRVAQSKAFTYLKLIQL